MLSAVPARCVPLAARRNKLDTFGDKPEAGCLRGMLRAGLRFLPVMLQFVRPLLCGVHDCENIDMRRRDPIGNDVGNIRKNEFAGSLQATDAAHGRMVGERVGDRDKARNDSRRRCGIIFCNPRTDLVEPA